MHTVGPVAYLAVVVLLASTIQSALGFGAMLVCLTLGSLVLPLPETMALVLPPIVLLSATIVARHHRAVAWGLLVRRVLPLMGLGVAVSLALVGGSPHPWLETGLGLIVLGLAVWELAKGGPARPLGRGWTSAGIVAAGLVHGVFATGGPWLVWSLAQEPIGKAALRASLTAVFLVMNVLLVGVFVARGTLTAGTAGWSAVLVLPLLVGIPLGEWLHDRVDERRFRLGVWGLLAVSAVALVVG